METQQTIQIKEGLKLFRLINLMMNITNRVTENLDDTHNIDMTLKNYHCKILNNHSSGYKIYFLTRDVSSSTTDV